MGFPTQEMEEIFHLVTWRPNTWFLRKLGLYVPFFWLPKLVPQIEFLRRNKGPLLGVSSKEEQRITRPMLVWYIGMCLVLILVSRALSMSYDLRPY